MVSPVAPRASRAALPASASSFVIARQRPTSASALTPSSDFLAHPAENTAIQTRTALPMNRATANPSAGTWILFLSTVPLELRFVEFSDGQRRQCSLKRPSAAALADGPWKPLGILVVPFGKMIPRNLR